MILITHLRSAPRTRLPRPHSRSSSPHPPHIHRWRRRQEPDKPILLPPSRYLSYTRRSSNDKMDLLERL